MALHLREKASLDSIIRVHYFAAQHVYPGGYMFYLQRFFFFNWRPIISGSMERFHDFFPPNCRHLMEYHGSGSLFPIAQATNLVAKLADGRVYSATHWPTSSTNFVNVGSVTSDQKFSASCHVGVCCYARWATRYALPRVSFNCTELRLGINSIVFIRSLW